MSILTQFTNLRRNDRHFDEAIFTPEQVKSIMRHIYGRGDRIIALFLLLHGCVALCLASFYDTWMVTFVVAGAAITMFLVSMLLLPRSFLTRCIAGISLQAFVALHIYQMHGLAEMHFFFFTAFTVMIVYQDWRSMWPGALLIIGQHILFAALTNSGVSLYFFEASYITVTKLAFHFGIALVQVGICGYWSYLLRRQTLNEFWNHERLQIQTNELRATKHLLDAAYQKQQRIADSLQRSLLNKPQTTAFPNLEFETVYKPAKDEAQVGGDYYDIFALSDAKVALVVGDVSGKGLDAAARTAQIKFALRAYVSESPDASSALQRLNTFLCESRELGDADAEAFFVCLTLAIVNTNSGIVDMAVACSEPVIVRGNGTTELIEAPALPLGTDAESHYTAITLELERDDVLILSTDGITEARNGHEFLGADGLAELAKAVLADESLTKTGEAILSGAQNFAGGVLQDDACIILARCHSNPFELSRLSDTQMKRRSTDKVTS